MRRGIDVAAVLGMAGAALAIAALISSLMGTKPYFDPGPYREFIELFRTLGYRIPEDGDIPPTPSKDIMVSIGEPSPLAALAPESRDAEIAEFLRRGGILVSAGKSGFEHLIAESMAVEAGTLEVQALGSLGEEAFDAWRIPGRGRFSPVAGSEVLVTAGSGAYVARKKIGNGWIYHFADDAAFIEPRATKGAGPVLVNALLRQYWGRNLRFIGRTVASSSPTSFFRALSNPGIDLLAIVLALAAASAIAARAIRIRGDEETVAPRDKSSSLQANAIGDFYARNRVHFHADGLLARRFGRSLRAAAPAAESLEAACTEVALRIGGDRRELVGLAEPLHGIERKEYERRRARRALFQTRIREAYAREGEES